MMRNVWWKLHAISMKSKRQREVLTTEGYAPDLCVDSHATDAETALIASEIFESLTPTQQEAVWRRLEGYDRGQPNKLYKASCKATRLRVGA